MAKIETRILEAETLTQSRTRSEESTGTAQIGLAISRRMGVRIESGVTAKASKSVPLTLKSVELFVGAGGLAIGMSRAGFKHDTVIEWNPDACAAILENQRLRVQPISRWKLKQADVREFDFKAIGTDVDLVAGGPPCQPFSLGGKHKGQADARDMFPQAVRAVRELQPKAVIFENVKGLLRTTFSDYFDYIKLQLAYPEELRDEKEGWPRHLSRLRKMRDQGSGTGLRYRVHHRLLNAANFGVPQRRERVFIVAFREDTGLDWATSSFTPTHSQESLLWDQWVDGTYWERHEISKRQQPTSPFRRSSMINALSGMNARPRTKAWSTVRDAIYDLPSPAKNRDSRSAIDHFLIPGARIYPGHTGSPLDVPAKTLKAGGHGVPGGENMLVLPDGKVRYFTIRESARIQTFPDNYRFSSSWTETMRQLGNAVPCDLGEAVGRDVRRMLEERFPA